MMQKFTDNDFDLPDDNNHTYYVGKNEIGWIHGRDGGWQTTHI